MAIVLAPLGAYGQSTSGDLGSYWRYEARAYERAVWWDNRWYVTPFAGWLITDYRRDNDNGWQGGFAIGKPFSPAWTFELRSFYEHASKDSSPFATTHKAWGLTLDAQWFPTRRLGYDNWYGTWNSVQPYLVIGAGAMKDDWDFIANAGGGIVWRFSDRARLVADARWRLDNASRHYDDVILSVGLQIPLPRVEAPPPPPPPPPPAPPPPKPQPVSRTVSIPGEGTFAFDSAELTDVGRGRVDGIISTVRAAGFTATSIALTGHTDPLGSTQYNQSLSERRAAAVRDYLVSRGIAANIITSQGRGEQDLKVTEADCRSKGEAKTRPALIACLAPDRRVDAVITGTQLTPAP
jgi:OOP family OmpA-OmpF porin